MNKLYLLLLLLSICFYNDTYGQEEKCRRTTQGTDFWVGFMESRWENNPHRLELTITAKVDSEVKIYLGDSNIPYNNITYNVVGGTSEIVEIEWELVEAIGSEVVENKGIHVISTQPINLYALNYDKNSSDVAMIFPSFALGREYYAMCYEPHYNRNLGRNSEFLIVATEDTTIVNITPSKITDKGRSAGIMFTDTLHKGQVYQVQSANVENAAGQGDLTGSYVVSDKPIAFFSGSHGTTIPATSNISAWDHLYEQLSPVRAWGREYMTVPLKTRESDRYRILAAKNNTQVVVNGTTSPSNIDVILQSGEFIEFSASDPCYIKSDKVIQVAQYSQSNKVDGRGDPFMIMLGPLSQTVDEIVFRAYTSDIIEDYYVNVLTKTANVDNIMLDGNPVNLFSSIPNSDFAYAQVDIFGGDHHLQSLNPNEGFVAYVYAYGGVESYGYGVGFNLDITLDLGSNINFEGDTLILCPGDTMLLDAGPHFDSYQWNNGATEQVLSISAADKYWIEASTAEGCTLYDSINILVSENRITLGPDTFLCHPEKILLNAGDEMKSYLWHDGSEESLMLVDTTGVYSVQGSDIYACEFADTVVVVDFLPPKITLIGDSLNCGTYQTAIAVNVAGPDKATWDFMDAISYSYKGPGNLTFTFTDPTHFNVEVDTYGDYEIYYHLETSEGCNGAAYKNLSFYPIPGSQFTIENNLEECNGYNVQVEYIDEVGPTALFDWTFGGSSVVDTLDYQKYLVTVGIGNFDREVTLLVEDHGCYSEKTVDRIGVTPLFSFDSDIHHGCDSVTVQFTSKTEEEVIYSWDFGDGSTSNLAAPAHTYLYPDSFHVNLTIESVIDGCVNAFTYKDMVLVYPTPTAELSAQSDVCYPDTIWVKHLSPTIDKTYHWSYSGLSEISNKDSAVQVVFGGSPFAKVGLQVTEFGCTSFRNQVDIKRKPNFEYTESGHIGCEPFTVDYSAYSGDSFLDYTWHHSDIPYNGDKHSYTYSPSGVYDVKLFAYSSETMCYDVIEKKDWVVANIKPIAYFDMDFPKATIKSPHIQFVNKSLYGDYYYWDFDDTEYSSEENPMHTYKEVGYYNVSLTVETEHTCLDTLVKEVQILPFSAFAPNAFNPNSHIESNRVFLPVGLGADPNHFKFIIMDRWGKIMFETKNPEKAWRGENLVGNEAPAGVYVWYAKYLDIQGLPHEQKGTVTLVR